MRKGRLKILRKRGLKVVEEVRLGGNVKLTNKYGFDRKKEGGKRGLRWEMGTGNHKNSEGEEG